MILINFLFLLGIDSLKLSIKEDAALMMALRLELLTILQDTLKPEDAPKLDSLSKSLKQAEVRNRHACSLLTQLATTTDAESFFSHMKAMYPDDWLFKLFLAELLMKRAEYKASEILLLEIIQRHSKVADAYKKLGIIYEKTNSARTAIEVYKRALDLMPEDSLLYEKIILLTPDAEKIELLNEWETKSKFTPNDTLLYKYIKALRNVVTR